MLKLTMFFLFIYSYIFGSDQIVDDNMSEQELAIVIGASSSGKTTFCSAVSLLDNSWKHINEDDYCVEISLQLYQELFLEQFSIINQCIDRNAIYDAIKRDDIEYSSKLLDHDKIIVYNALCAIREELNGSQSELFYQLLIARLKDKIQELIKTAFENNYNIIIDSWMIRDFLKTYWQNQAEIIIVLIYTPFLQVIQNVIQRNNDPIFRYNHRFFEQVFDSFSKNYYFIQEPVDTIDQIAFEDLFNSFNAVKEKIKFAQKYGDKKRFSRREFNETEYLLTKKNWFDMFKGSSQLHLKPKMEHDLIFFPNYKDINQAANQFLSMIK